MIRDSLFQIRGLVFHGLAPVALEFHCFAVLKVNILINGYESVAALCRFLDFQCVDSPNARVKIRSVVQ